MKWSAEKEDLSLLPYMTGTDKEAMHQVGVTTVQFLATQKEFSPTTLTDLVTAMQEATKIGGTQLELKLTLPADFAEKEVPFTVVTPSGESAPHKLLVDKTPTVAEKEPNNGFKQAQVVQFPQVIDGAIGQAQDVDVFRFDGQAGQQVEIEVFAARLGSALDSYLTLYNGDGAILASNDDLDKSTTDSRIEMTLPKAGAYYVSVMDAHDSGVVG